MTAPGLLPLLAAGASRVLSLAREVTPLPPDTRCLAVDDRFQSDPECASLLVAGPERPDAVGLVQRPRFLQVMSGRFGFGRALFGGAPVADVAVWDPVVIDGGATIQQAAAAVLMRAPEARYDDLVVRLPDRSWGTLSAAAVLEALSRELAERALFDALTGLANRELLLAELAQSQSQESQERPGGACTALLFIDLDRFKQVNDVHGHNAGDALLRAVAGRLLAAARPGDLVARLGGDEFAVMLTLSPERGTDPTRTATAVATRFLRAIAEPVPVAGVNLLVGASIGVAVSATGGSEPDTLLREADMAMYQAKRAGGDRVHTVSSVGSQLSPALVGLAIDDTLARALGDDEFVLHYQPIVDLGSGRTVSVEALIRWQHPTRGLRPPGEFLPAAEASGLVVALDRWVLAAACAQLARWDGQLGTASPAHVDVNVSRPHLAHPGLAEHVLEAVERSGLAAGRLRLELPEVATVSDLQAAAPALDRLRDAGVALTLDDLGAGSSTLRHLSELRLDGVKIDRSFIQGLLLNERDAAVVRLLVDLAHNIGVCVTAEGIESAAQREALVALGCTLGQGYHLGRPVPAAEYARTAAQGVRTAVRPLRG